MCIMKCYGRVLLAVILASAFVFSCKDTQLPANLVISGITSEVIAGDIVSIDEDQNTLTLDIKSAETEHRLVITPWPGPGVPGIDSFTVKAHQYHEPAGPVRFIVFYQNTDIVAMICENVKRLPAPLHHIQLRPGERVKGSVPTNRVWVDVILTAGDTEKRLLPGKQYGIMVDNKEWNIYITGASVPVKEEKPPPASGEGGPIPGENGETAGEEAGFSVDCIIFQN